MDDNKIYKTTAIACHFNNYFAYVGNKLAQIYADQDEKLFLKFLGKRSPNSIFLESTFPAEVFSISYALIPNKSPGLDGFSSYFVKIAADVIAVPLSTLCNLSFSKEIFSECMKSAKVVPLFKSD